MNKHRYRLIFNGALGVWQVASELARCLPGRTDTADNRRLKLPPAPMAMAVAWALGTALLFPSAVQARIVANPDAPGNRQPTVLKTANGVPLVNIQTPNEAGVSRNSYRQFDVTRKGVILNNARQSARTRLGGWVSGNPWLATGSAKVILNQVVSPDPSQLRGYAEVAGKHAEVVIANPSGIYCDGCGFINTHRVTLTTGNPEWKHGAIAGYRVTGGLVRVEGSGMDAGQVDYTNLIARSVKANAGIWANTLRVITGVNKVNADATDVTPVDAGDGGRPALAIDVGKLGGMYANRIFLVGTERGVGVGNAGTIGASAGNLVVTVDGRLVNAGSMQATGDVTMRADEGVANSGMISSARQITLHTPAAIDNAGGKINARRLAIHADSLANRYGGIEQTGPESLVLDVGKLVNGEGGAIGAMPVSASTAGDAASPAASDDEVPSATSATESGTQTASPSQSVNPIMAAMPAPGAVTVAHTFDNTAGHLAATGGIDVDISHGLDNDGGQLALRTLSISSGDLDNRAGSLTVAGDSRIHVAHIRNDGGTWTLGGDWSVKAGSWSNRGGSVQHAGTQPVTLNVAGTLDNTGGSLATRASHLALSAGTLINADGSIRQSGTDGFALTTGDLQGRGGTIVTAGELALEADDVDQRQGTLVATRINLTAASLDNTGGRIVASGSDPTSLAIAGPFTNTQGTLASNGALSVHAATLDNTGGRIVASGSDPTTLAVAGTFTNADGELASNGALAVHAAMLDNTGGRLVASGPDPTTLAIASTFTNTKGSLTSNGALAVHAATLDGRAGVIRQAGDGDLVLDVDTLDATDGTLATNNALIIDGQTTRLAGATTTANRVTINTGYLVTAHGSLTASGDDPLTLDATGTIDNTGGNIRTNGPLVITAAALDNTAGTLGAAGNEANTLDVAGTFTNAKGTLATNAGLTVHAARLDGREGVIRQAGDGDLVLDVDAIDATGGTLATNNALIIDGQTTRLAGATTTAHRVTINTGDLVTAHGKLMASGDGPLTLHATGTFDNTGGSIRTNGHLAIAAAALDNTAGTLGAAGNEANTVDVAGTFTNTKGTLATNAGLTVHAATLDGRDGVIRQAGDGDLVLDVDTLDATDGTLATNNALIIDGQTTRLAGATTTANRVTINTGDLITAHGKLTASGDDPLTLHATGTLDNTGGSIRTNGPLAISAAAFDNHEGTVLAAGKAANQVTIGGQWNNRNGKLVTVSATTITAGQLDNTAGSLQVAEGGSLDLNVAGQLTNTANGTIAATGATRITADELDNRTGTIQSTGQLDVAVDHGIDNTAGTLAANGDITVAADSLVNADGGLLASVKGGATVATRGKLDNASGSIQAARDMDITSHDLANRHGKLIGEAVVIDASQHAIDNGNGLIAATDGDARIDAGTLNNAEGLVQAANNVTVHAGTTSNERGLMSAGDILAVTADHIDNRQTGDVVGQGLQGNRVHLSAGSIDNEHGLVAADAGIRVDGTGADSHVENRNGLITSAGTLAISADRLSNTDGTVISGGDQTLHLGRFSGDGKLLSKGNLDLSMTDGWHQTGIITVNETANLVTAGDFTNDGTLQAGALNIVADTINNRADATIDATRTHVTARDTLTNRGLVNGVQTRIDADHVLNIGTGRIYGDHVAIQAGTLDNREGTRNGKITAATIAARQRLDLGVGTLDNREHAQILSIGSGDDALTIGGRLDADGHAVGQADDIHNASATIESSGGMTIHADRLLNSNEHFKTDVVQVGGPESITIIEPDCDWASWCHKKFTLDGSYDYAYDPSRGTDPAEMTINGHRVSFKDFYRFEFQRRYYESRVVQSDPGIIRAAGDMTLQGNRLVNDKSQIIAGGNLSGDLLSLQNVDAPGVSYYKDAGKVTYLYVDGNDDRDDYEDPYSFESNHVAISLPVSMTKEHAGQAAGHDVSDMATSTVDGVAQGSGGAKDVKTNGVQVGSTDNLDAASSTVLDRLSATDGASAADVDSTPGNAIEPGATTPTTDSNVNFATTGAPQTVPVDIDAPTASLFRRVPAASGYLIETDPQFTKYRQWLGSDYMLNQLAHDPKLTQKRLGDGFYEQRLVREQVARLTGRRFLGGYGSDLAQYRALMNAGIAFAKQYDLTPGVELTSAQMAKLTSDIVWLVDRTVTLPDGSTTTALVPKVYLRPHRARVQPTGSLISAGSIALSTHGDLVNGGSLLGRNDVRLDARNLSNIGGTIQGNVVTLQARHDLSNIGGSLLANKALVAQAGHDLVMASTTHHAQSRSGDNAFDTTVVDQVANVRVDAPDGVLALGAGHDLRLTATQLSNSGRDSQTLLTAGHDITADTVKTHRHESLVWDDDNYLRQGHAEETGTTLSTGGDIAFAAGNDVTLRAASVHSDNGAIGVQAGHDIRLTTGQARHRYRSKHKYTSDGFLSSTTVVTRDSGHATWAQGSTVSGREVALQAGHDIGIIAGNVVADNNVTAVAGHDIKLQAATNRSHQYHYKKKTASGLFAGGGASGLGGIGFTIGSSKTRATGTLDEQTTASSLIGSAHGNVVMAAGGDLTVDGSDVVAGRAPGSLTGGNIVLRGKNVTVAPATRTRHARTTYHSSQHGFSVALVGTPLDGLRDVQATRHQPGGSGSKAVNGMRAIGAMLGDTPGVAVGYGSARASRSSRFDGTSQRGSNVRAAGDLTVDATAGDLAVIGSTLQAGGTATLRASHDINLLTSVGKQAQATRTREHHSRYTLAPVSGGDLARHLDGGPNHSGVSLSPYNAVSADGNASRQAVGGTGTTVTARHIKVVSQHGDITMKGAQLAATGDLNVVARQGAITLDTGRTRSTRQSHHSQHRIGDLGGNGYAGMMGEASSEQDAHGKQVAESPLRTALTSRTGDVSILARGDLVGRGVDIAGRDVTLVGRNVSLLPSQDATARSRHSRSSQAGITVSTSGIAVQAAQAADAAIAAHDRGDNRLAALYAAEAAYGASDASQTAGSIDYSRAGQAASGHAAEAGASPNGDASLIKATVSIGGGHQSSRSATRSRTQQGSTLMASRDVTVLATGDGTTAADGYSGQGDILMRGATVQAGHDITLAAARDISLLASRDTSEQHRHHEGSHAGIGVGFALGGAQNGFTLELAAAGNKGKAQGTGTVHQATRVTAGNTLRLTSGRDTTLHGAQAKGEAILADVGRNLVLTSTQDSQHYDEKDQSAGASLSLCIPPFCYGTSSGGASYSQTDLRNTYRSVTDQTGLAAGKGGFTIHVGDTTSLTGTAIASTATPDKNLLDTGSLKYSSLHNVADSRASQVGASFNSGGSLGRNLTQNAAGAALNMAIPQGGKHTSETTSGIAQGTLIVRDHPDQDLMTLDRDVTTLDGNGVTNDFDPDQIKTNQALGQAAGYVGMRTVGAVAGYAERQAAADWVDARQRGDTEAAASAMARMKAWGNGGTRKTLLHGLVGAATAALGGGNPAQGALGAAAGEAASNAMVSYLADHGIAADSATGKSLITLASGIVGRAAGGQTGAVTAMQGERYNRQLHLNESKVLNAMLQQVDSPEQARRLVAAACALTRCADGVPDSDTHKAMLVALQQEGGEYKAEQTALKQTGLFTYGSWDNAKDWMLEHDHALTRIQQGMQVVSGEITATGGAVLAVGGCAASMGTACAISAPLGMTLASNGLATAQDGLTQLQSPYRSTQGQRVMASFNPATYPGEQHPALDTATSVGTLAASAVGGRWTVKYLDDLNSFVGAISTAPSVAKSGWLGKVPRYVLGTGTGDSLIAGSSNVAVQLIQNGGHVNGINWINAGAAATAAGLGHGHGLLPNAIIGGATGIIGTDLGNWVYGKDQDVLIGGAVSAMSAAGGYGVNKYVSSMAQKIGASNDKAWAYGAMIGSGFGEAESTTISNLAEDTDRNPRKDH